MKQLTILLFTLFAAIILTTQLLTHRGGKAMPAEMVIATFAEFENGDQVTVYDNLYYSLCPEWPDSTEVRIAGTVRNLFRQNDFERGYIQIEFTATPLPNCPTDDLQSKVITIWLK